MQHHGGPTRLLDWSDGSLVAMHFAVRNGRDDQCDAFVHVLDPYRLEKMLEKDPDWRMAEDRWKLHVRLNPHLILRGDEAELSYLPADEDYRVGVPLPKLPVVLEYPHITRRVAAQRSRFVVFGTDYTWLAKKAEQAGDPESPIRVIRIDRDARPTIREQLRDGGITESVIFPDLDGLGKEIRQIWEERIGVGGTDVNELLPTK